jgi:hypothetical protein
MSLSVPVRSNRRGSIRMPDLDFTFRIVRHVVKRGQRYGRLAVTREVQTTGADGRRYRAALCRCDCGKQVIPRISSLTSGDAQSCGCSRGQSRNEQKHCPVCGVLAMIRRDHRSCSRACGHELARASRQAANPSYDVWHKRVTQARGPARRYAQGRPGRALTPRVTGAPSRRLTGQLPTDIPTRRVTALGDGCSLTGCQRPPPPSDTELYHAS